jgi:aryl-alcohol dehydrogenase
VVRAAVFRLGTKIASIESANITDVRNDEVVVRVVATGVCHSDLIFRNGISFGTYPMILGHEGAGVVERVGSDVRKVVPGDHVVLSFAFCGVCPSCSNQKPFNCHSFASRNFVGRRQDGTSALVVDGESIGAHFFGQSSFSSHSVVQERNVVKVPSDAPLELLGPLGCGVQTGAGTVMNVLRPRPGESMAIFGAGGVGLSALMAAVVEGAGPILVIEPHPERRALALEFGAHFALDPGVETDLKSKIIHLSGGGPLHVVDTTGIPDILTMATEALAPCGKLALLTLNAEDALYAGSLRTILSRGLAVHGVCEGESVADVFIPKLVRLISEGRFPLHRLVKFYDFSEINQALDDVEFTRAIKPILRISQA